ncbi:MAG: phosphatidylglycerophosphatase A [candidate division Zixibacteria bacterium]|nr:phosphatidylglycerophosphatase A [candidate division Zixibacteria bacterium]
MKTALVKFIATGMYSGYLRPYAGTWGTIPAWLIAWFLIRGNTPMLGAVAVITTLVSVWAAMHAEKIYGHDAKKIVIDEWAGMFITVLLVPYTLTNYAIAFFAFRLFDVLKIPPARQCERLPHGWGITMDDVVAGIFANVFVQLVIYITANYG